MLNLFHTSKQKQRSSKGFTLIELLVVIAIIAILAAILFPVFARARENSRRASCQSNLKQISLGIKQYMQDYDDTFIKASWNTSDGSPALYPNGWAAVLQPYVKSDQIYQCPSQPNRDNVAADLTTQDFGYSDYFFNSNLGANVDCSGKRIVKESELDYSSNVIMIGDGGRGGATNFANYPPLQPYPSGTASGTQVSDLNTRPAYHYLPGFWTKAADNASVVSAAYAYTDGKYMQQVNDTHLQGMNIGFVDGHVKWYKPEKLTFDNPSGSNVTFKVNDINAGTDASKPGCTP